MQTSAPTQDFSRAERLAPLVAGLLVALPTLLTHYPPMTDLPLHEGAVGMLRHFWDEAYFPRGLYSLNLGRSNQLFYFVAWPLSYAVGTVWACKIVIATSQVLIFTTGARFADHLGRSRWAALLLAPLALGFTYYWGLVTNLVGFVALFYTLPILDRFVEKPTRRGVVTACAALALQYFAHGSVFAIGVAVLVGLTACKPLDARATTLRLAPALITGAAAVLNHLSAAHLFARGTFRAATAFLPLGLKLRLFSNVLFGSHDWVMRDLMLVISLGTLASFVVSRWRAGEGPIAPLSSFEGSAFWRRAHRLQSVAYRYRFEVLGFAFLFGYFAMPFNWNGATLLHERCLGPAWGLLVICAAPRGPVARVVKLTAAVIPLGVVLLGWPQFVDASRTHRDLEALLETIPKGSAVTLCSLDRRMASARIYSTPAGATRSLAIVGGRSGMSLLSSPIAPVQLRRDARWSDYELREFFYASRGFKPAHDFRHFGWVIGHSRDPEVRSLMTESFAPEADLVMARGEWLLFHSRLPVSPIDAPDDPAPADLDTVVDRLSYLANKKLGVPIPPTPAPPTDPPREP